MRSLARLTGVLCAALLGGVLLSGCGTTTAENVALADKMLPRSHARLKIYRESEVMAAGLPARVTVDGREVASLGVGGSTVLDVPAGSHKIAVDTWSHPNAYTLNLAAKPGMLYTLEVSPRSQAVVAGMFGLVGMMVEASANENGGNFQIRVVESTAAKR